MALPTSDNTVNVTRLGSILNTLWGKIKTKLGTKVDKVANATSGNLASLDSNGNLTDSTKSVSDLQSTYQAPRTLKVGGQVEIVSAEYPSNRKDITFTKTDGTSAGTLGSLVPVPDSSNPGQILKVGSQAGSIEWNNIPNIAPEFSTSSTYDVNDRVMYQGQLYRCTSAVTTAGEWNSSNWTAVNLSDEIDSLSSELNYKQGLQGNQGTQIPSNSDLNDYTTPGNYYIVSAGDMVTISNTPFAQMGFASSETSKTGQSQLTVYNMNGNASGRVMQVMYTIYSINPTGDNAHGFWYRMSAGVSQQTSQQTWGDWHRMLQTNGYAPYRYGSTTPSTATKSAELLTVKVGSATTYHSLTIAVTISGAANNQNMFVLATLSIRGNTPKIDAEVINHNFSSLDIGRVRFYAQNNSKLITTYGIVFPDEDEFTYTNITYIVLSHSGSLYESTVLPSFNNVWLLHNPILSSSTPVYTVYTDLYSKNSHHGPGLWCGYKNSANYLLITVKQIDGGTAGESILISFAGNQYGVMMKLCFGMDSAGGFNGSVPTLHVIECNNWANAEYNPLFTSGGGVAKYYYDSTNKLYHFLLKTTTTNRMMCIVESANTENYYFEQINTSPSWLSSASDIAKGHALPHITSSAVGSQIGSTTRPVYVDAGGGIVACSQLVKAVSSIDTSTMESGVLYVM